MRERERERGRERGGEREGEREREKERERENVLAEWRHYAQSVCYVSDFFYVPSADLNITQ